MLVERHCPLRRIRETFAVHRGVALLGPRQCGKTTLARASMAAPYALDERLSVEPVHRLGKLLNDEWPEA